MMQLMTSAATIAAPTEHPAKQSRRISALAVRDMCGGVSDMTLWRWLNDPAKNFPKPIYISLRRYWKEQDVVAWLDAQDGARLASGIEDQSEK